MSVEMPEKIVKNIARVLVKKAWLGFEVKGLAS
jgi:hypothetical protein